MCDQSESPERIGTLGLLNASKSATCLSTLLRILAHLAKSSCALVLLSSLRPLTMSFLRFACFLCCSVGRRVVKMNE